jgi:hypothetical protein
VKALKWLEANIKQPNNISKSNFLVEKIKPLVKDAKNTITVQSWHFLWEGVPYPSTLRLRFLVETEKVDLLKNFVEDNLNGFEHSFGAHGNPGAEYDGEASEWGVKGWEKGMEFLQYGSELAIELIENKESLGVGDNYKKNGSFFADRYTHLFLNQLESLLIEKDGVDEANFEMCEGIFRYAVQYVSSKYADRVADASQVAGQIVRASIEAAKKKTEEQADLLLSRV